MGISTLKNQANKLNKKPLTLQVIDNTSHPDVDNAPKITVKITVAFVRQPIISATYI